MYAQLFLGIFFIIQGITKHFSRKPNLLISKVVFQRLSDEEVSSYLKKVGKVNILFGLIVVTMGQIEYRYQPNPWIFLPTYILLGLACIALIIYINKRYTGNMTL
ncbi:MAG TPA: hypothetical protein VKZ77_02980 [Bacillaceae bacterium]|nr:DUF3784 domain-containing protein [Paenibacillus bovis]HLU21428.1 hypothetical protein [Bacillaceae bacterium]